MGCSRILYSGSKMDLDPLSTVEGWMAGLEVAGGASARDMIVSVVVELGYWHVSVISELFMQLL